MKTHRCFIFVGLSLSWITLGGNVQAQWIGALSSTWSDPIAAYLSVVTQNNIMAGITADAAKGKSVQKSGTATTEQPARQSSGKLESVTFQPVATSLIVHELAQEMAETKAGRDQLSGAFQEFLRAFEQQAREAGQSYELSRAAAFFTMANYAVATGLEPTENQTKGAGTQFRAAFSGSAGFRKMTNRGAPSGGEKEMAVRQSLWHALGGPSVAAGNVSVPGWCRIAHRVSFHDGSCCELRLRGPACHES
jgi:hypothetical protein